MDVDPEHFTSNELDKEPNLIFYEKSRFHIFYVKKVVRNYINTSRIKRLRTVCL
jgi:hypothetical protein